MPDVGFSLQSIARIIMHGMGVRGTVEHATFCNGQLGQVTYHSVDVLDILLPMVIMNERDWKLDIQNFLSSPSICTRTSQSLSRPYRLTFLSPTRFLVTRFASVKKHCKSFNLILTSQRMRLPS